MEKNEFPTPSLPLVAFLLAKGHKLSRTFSSPQSNRLVFVFKRTERLERDVQEYALEGTVQIQPYLRAYSAALKLAKELAM